MTRLPIDTPDDPGHYADLRNGWLMRLPRFPWGAFLLGCAVGGLIVGVVL